MARVTKTLAITSPQLHAPLEVELSGEGIARGGEGDLGPDGNVPSTSFYACSGCTTGDPTSTLALASSPSTS